PTLSEILAVVDRLWPDSGAEAWDAPGLITGDPSRSVEAIHLAVDATVDTAEEAVENGSGLLLVHHPLLLRGVTSVREDRYKGAVIAKLLRADCALLAAHTNADVVETGTSATLADALGLLEQRPLVPAALGSRGLGRVGRLPEPQTLGSLARKLAELLPATAGGVKVSGDFDAPVQTVSLCGGAGDSLLASDAVLASDVYVTSDLRHHPASEFRENAQLSGGPALIDVSHWASEWLWLETA